jgi:hypothetical protein
VRFEVLTAEKIQIEVFWVVTLCSVAVGYLADITTCHHNPEDLDLKIITR